MRAVLAFCPLVLVAGFLLGCTQAGGIPRYPQREMDIISMSRETASHIWLIQYGYDSKGQLLFIAIAGKRTPASGGPGVSSLAISDDAGKLRLKTPEGREVPLGSTFSLYESVDGSFEESSERISMDEFEAFMASKPDDYRIGTLLRFVKYFRANPPAGGIPEVLPHHRRLKENQ